MNHSEHGAMDPMDGRAALAEGPEGAEREAWADLLAAAAQAPSAASRVSGRRLGADGLWFSVPTLPMTLFNRVFGLGLQAAPDDDLLDSLPSLMAAAPAGRWAVQPAPGPHEAAFRARLVRRGYAALGQRIAKMAIDLRAAPPAASAAGKLVVTEIGADQAADFADPIVQGMGLPPWYRDWLLQLPGRTAWHCYGASLDGRAVAAAAMFRHADIAWLGMATTLPEARGLGAQRALMQRRLHDAAAAGCRMACSETGEPQPGQPHPSYSNMLGCGLQRVATRVSWALPAPLG